MDHFDVKILDCTLRDGGYINQWEWGFDTARSIIRQLARTGVDYIEVGFLRNVDGYNPNISVCNSIEELNKLLPDQYHGDTMFSGMAMRSNYDIDKLSPYCGHGIEMIRVTAHDYDLQEGLLFAKAVKEKGYKVSINPINIMGYTDEQILHIIDGVNEVHPYQFSIVDTFGSMKRRDLDRIVNLVDHNLDRDIRLALHLHENMSLACCLAQNYIDMHLNRAITVDGSLMGMGRIPGNLPIELIADYMNEYEGKNYDIDYMMDAIEDYISPLKGKAEWGYTPAYFLSARFNLHRNYAEYFLNRGDLTNRDINHILSHLDRTKATVFDKEYAFHLYDNYKNNIIDDFQARQQLQESLAGSNILILAPGSTLLKYNEKIKSYIEKNKPIIISVNFIPDDFNVDYGFFSNSRRFDLAINKNFKIIGTSNLPEEGIDYLINYNSLSGAFALGSNSMVMLLKLLRDFGFDGVALAGADGFVKGQANYYSSSIANKEKERDADYNYALMEAIRNIGIQTEFITPSEYQKY